MGKRIKKKLSALNIGSIVMTVLAHIAVIVFVILARGYFNLEPKAIICVLLMIVCILIIIDILLAYGFKFKNIATRIVIIVLSALMIIVGFGGSFYVSKVNKAVNNVIENTGTGQYETISGTFVYYNKNSTKTYSSLDDLKKVSNLKVGVVIDGGSGVGTSAQKLLSDNGINASIVTFNTSEDLLGALVGNLDEDVDVAVFSSSYRQRWLAEEDMDYEQYLDNIVEFATFEDKVKTGENQNANKALYTEPFNILLIGFAPEDEAMTVGLADTIIVATVNPQTFTVSLTSVPRDTYTNLSCVPNGERQKINAARGYSRQCLMDTVGDLLGIDINYYMEVNFLGVVEIVNAVGGIVINNPVEFVGQSASGIRGEYTVLVPAGENIPADGDMALAFARERHAMPNGDFDRQQHQQEVIAQIVEKLLGMNDVNQALKVMEAAGNNFTTNLSLNQLTGIFNYLISHNNTVGISTFNMINIINLRLTGYSSWYYSYSMRLPQWIYRLYQGSISEIRSRINDVMNNYTTSDIKQWSYMKFFVEYPYTRSKMYSDYFNEEQVHEEMPANYPYLIGIDLASAISKAQEQGIELNINYIEPGMDGYDEGSTGLVVDQYPRQGALVSEYPTGTITVMGPSDPDKVEYTVTNCNDEASCIAFANAKGIEYKIVEVYDANNEHQEGEFYGSNYKNGDKIKKNALLEIYKWTKQIAVPSYTAGQTKLDDYKTALDKLGLKYTISETSSGASESNNGTVASTNPAIGTKVTAGTTIQITCYKYTQVTPPSGGGGESGGGTQPGGSESGGSQPGGSESGGSESGGSESGGSTSGGSESGGEAGAGDSGQSNDVPSTSDPS